MSALRKSTDREIFRMQRQERIKALLEAQSLSFGDMNEMIHQLKKHQAVMEAGKYDDIDDYPLPLDTVGDEPVTKKPKRSFDEYQDLERPSTILSTPSKPSTENMREQTELPNHEHARTSFQSVHDDLLPPSSSSQVDSASDYQSSTPGALLGSDCSLSDPPSPTQTFPSGKPIYGSSPNHFRQPADGGVRGLMRSVHASSSPPPNAAGTLLDPPEGRDWRPLTMNPMISKVGKIKTGDFVGEHLATMLPEHCRTRSDWLRHLYHYGTIQLGHENVDAVPCTIIAEYEIAHGVGLGNNGERLCPPEKFIFGFGQVHRNKTLEQAGPAYVEQMYKAKENRPWLREAVELSRSLKTTSFNPYRSNSQSHSSPSRQMYNHHKGSYDSSGSRSSTYSSYNRAKSYTPQERSKYPTHFGAFAGDGSSFRKGPDDFVIAVSDLEHVSPDRLGMLKAPGARSTGESPSHTSTSFAESPSPLERGQRTLPSAFTIAKRESGSTPAPAPVMDLSE
ncbi:hypothetical protein GT037_004131 [Alternaria burnsii]|uniref:Uncharacterized protein n=1 Tax=Alternaria burnsii TaxID=1187904 RepID=A0A8H7BB51_9PLEO|nr:uncharacterized protein GT037_004131 [Alternaria burnsii]KAF7678750.1 hypothetical protein GT037_004131 [Alternaria burnsii]CAI9636445.1 unnamed protein product [Alternaria burnsii]